MRTKVRQLEKALREEKEETQRYKDLYDELKRDVEVLHGFLCFWYCWPWLSSHLSRKLCTERCCGHMKKMGFQNREASLRQLLGLHFFLTTRSLDPNHLRQIAATMKCWSTKVQSLLEPLRSRAVSSRLKSTIAYLCFLGIHQQQKVATPLLVQFTLTSHV